MTWNQKKKNKNNSNIEPDYYIVEFKSRRIDYYIDRNHLGLKRGDWVLVQAERGRDMGVVFAQISKEDFEAHSQHKYALEILRRARDDEIEIMMKLREREESVLETCEELVGFRGLKMKLVDAEFQYDGKKLTIYFTAEERVDFRELVKDLAAIYRTRIELRQIGVRDEAKKLGGIGPCGMPLCCATFLRQFVPISTQMARAQNLVVNPSKISGLCERLMCCLAYEMPFYEVVLKDYPHVGDEVTAKDGRKAKVVAIDYFRGFVKLIFEGDEEPTKLGIIEYKKLFKSDKEFLKKWLSKSKAESAKTANQEK